MTGIGINLREVQDDDGKVRLKVLGLLLDGPAHAAGVRQVNLYVNIDVQLSNKCTCSYCYRYVNLVLLICCYKLQLLSL